MNRPKRVLLLLLALAGILTLVWLLRDMVPPPDCRFQPDDPACKAP